MATFIRSFVLSLVIFGYWHGNTCQWLPPPRKKKGKWPHRYIEIANTYYHRPTDKDFGNDCRKKNAKTICVCDSVVVDTVARKWHFSPLTQSQNDHWPLIWRKQMTNTHTHAHWQEMASREKEREREGKRTNDLIYLYVAGERGNISKSKQSKCNDRCQNDRKKKHNTTNNNNNCGT